MPHVFLAVTEDGLTTAIGGGENSGRTLQHAAVVRELRDLGSVKNGSFEKTVEVARHSGWNAANLKVAVLVQDSDGGPIRRRSLTALPTVSSAFRVACRIVFAEALR